VTGPPIYRQMLGGTFAELDAPVQRFHSLQGHYRLSGRCTVGGAEHPLGRLLCLLLRLPRATTASDFTFDLEADGSQERWTRNFPTRRMRSLLSVTADRRLRERLGPARLEFSIQVADGSLTMHLEQIRVFGLRWPQRWLPSVWAIECGDQGRFCFDVGARLGGLGSLVVYSGHLELDSLQELP
jgi:hypothetical protein